jgi:hypothetical protein
MYQSTFNGPPALGKEISTKDHPKEARRQLGFHGFTAVFFMLIGMLSAFARAIRQTGFIVIKALANIIETSDVRWKRFNRKRA